MSKRHDALRKLVHDLRYRGGDCISEHLRVLFPVFHSKFCDEAVLQVVGFMASDSVGSFEEESIADKLRALDNTEPC